MSKNSPGGTACVECYANNNTATPLRGAEECLSGHRQYICATCGRMICADVRGTRRARCFMPFGSLEESLLYLRAAEVISGGACAVWEFIYPNGDHRFRIFGSTRERNDFLVSSRKVRPEGDSPVYSTGKYSAPDADQLRYVTKDEMRDYLSRRNDK